MTDTQISQILGDENTSEVIATNRSIGNYFNRVSSGDIGNQNLSAGGGYSSAAWGANGTNGEKLPDNMRTDPNRNMIPLMANNKRAYGPAVNICPINARKYELLGDTGADATAELADGIDKEGFYQDINDVDTDSLQTHGVDYVARERYHPIITDKEAIAFSVSILIAVLFWILVAITFYIIYIKRGYGPKITSSAVVVDSN